MSNGDGNAPFCSAQQQQRQHPKVTHAASKGSSPFSLRRFLSGLRHCMWMFCWPPCPSRIASKFAFYPPRSASYKFTKRDNSADLHDVSLVKGGIVSTYLPGYELDPCLRARMTGYFVNSSQSKNRIACVLVRASERPGPFTILLSHGNACDLGMLFPLVSNLIFVTKCNIVLYDYSGYGLSQGEPSERNVYADTKAVLDDVCSRERISPKEIILFGQSIGTTAAVELASKEQVGGVILEAPLLSGLKVIGCCSKGGKLGCPWSCLDSFSSEVRAPSVKSPVLILHGTHDTVIDLEHGIELCRRCPCAVAPLFIEGGGHSDLGSFESYYVRIKTFIYIDIPAKAAEDKENPRSTESRTSK